MFLISVQMVLLGSHGKSSKVSRVSKPPPSNQSTLSSFFGLSNPHITSSVRKPTSNKHEARLVKSFSGFLNKSLDNEIDLTSDDDADILRDISNKRSMLSRISSGSGFDQSPSKAISEEVDNNVVNQSLKSNRPIGSLLGAQKENLKLPDYYRSELSSPSSNADRSYSPYSSTPFSQQSTTTSTTATTLTTSISNLTTLGSMSVPGSKQSNSSQTYRQRTLPWANNAKGVINKLSFKNPRLTPSKQIQLNPSSQKSRSSSDIVLSEEQQLVIKYVLEDKLNVFYTGSAGTGKSVLLKELIKKLNKKYGAVNVAVTASTGLAAVNIGGQTINRFAGIGLGKEGVRELVQKITRSKVSEKWKKIKVLIIDEVSMIDGNLFQKLNEIAKTIRKSALPFGGIQIVVTGDFFQLPPVPDRNGPRPIFCFQSPSWPEVIQRTILLTKVFRQKGDLQLIDMLNALRIGEVNDDLVKQFRALQRSVVYEDGLEPTELFPMRYEVDRANKLRLDKLPSQVRSFKAIDTGAAQYVNMLDNVMAVKELHLKEDAQVMMLKNRNDFLVNGSIGRVLYFLTPSLYEQVVKLYKHDLDGSETIANARLLTKCIGISYFPPDLTEEFNRIENPKFKQLVELATREKLDDILPVVKFSSTDGMNEIVLVENDEFKVDIKGQSIVRNQLPLLLSWALSIHKSQGQTLERVKVDLNKVFENGQVYVALSRAVSKESLQIIGFNPSKIRCSGEVRKFYDSLERLL